MRWLGGVQVRGCLPNVSTVLLDIAHLHGFDARCRFEVLFQERGRLRVESIKFLLFVKEKLPFGADPQKDEWISAQANHVMETLAQLWDNPSKLVPGVIDIVRWGGLQFASPVYAILVQFFCSSSFVDAPEQDPAAFPRQLYVLGPSGRLRRITCRV